MKIRPVACVVLTMLLAVSSLLADEPGPCLTGSAPLISDMGKVGEVKKQIDALDEALGDEDLQDLLELVPDLKKKVDGVKENLGKVKDPLDKVEGYVELINEGSILFYATQCLNSPDIDPSTPVFAFAMGQAARSVGEIGKKVVKVPDQIEFARDWIFEFFIQMEHFFTNMHQTMTWCIRHHDFCVQQCQETGNFCEYRSVEQCTVVPEGCYGLMALSREAAEKDDADKSGDERNVESLMRAAMGKFDDYARISMMASGMPPRRAIDARNGLLLAYDTLVNQQQLYASFGAGATVQKLSAYVSDTWERGVCEAQVGLVEAAKKVDGQVLLLDDLEALQDIEPCDDYSRNRAALILAQQMGTEDLRSGAAKIDRVELPSNGQLSPSRFGNVRFRVLPDSDRSFGRMSACLVPTRQPCTEANRVMDVGVRKGQKQIGLAKTESGDRWEAFRPGARYVCVSYRFSGDLEPTDSECVRIPRRR